MDPPIKESAMGGPLKDWALMVGTIHLILRARAPRAINELMDPIKTT